MSKHKINFKRFLAITMTLSMVFSTNAFATPINLANSTESVATDTLDKANGTDYFADEDTNNWQDGSIVEETRVTVSKTSQFEITIPKEVVLDGSTGQAAYKVKAKGDIAGDQTLTVIPDADFILSEAGGKSNVTATVTQPNTEYDYVKLQGDGTEYNGNISAILTAGEWSGKFSFNIEFKDVLHTHSYTSTVTKQATCIEQGEKTYTCDCGDTYTENIAIDPNNHNYDEGVVTKAATCTEKGVRTYTCTRCNGTKTEEIAIDSTNHNYVAIPTKQATCTEEGVMTYTCTRCSDIEKTEPIPKLSHTYDEGIITKQPTCTETGIITYTCLCGDIHLENVPINPENHNYDEGIVTKAATCTETGIKTFTCTKCSNSYTENIAIDPLNHNGNREIQETKSWQLISGDFSQNGNMWTSTNKTYGTTGTATWTITLDQDTEISIPYDLIIDHSFPFFTVELDGIEIINYDNDFPGTYITTLSQGTHTITAEFENYANRPDITNTENNSEAQLTLNDITNISYGCSEDDHIHELVTEITKEPTCTEAGLKTYACQNCSYIYRTEVITATGHNYDSVLTKEATETENGEITYTCSQCGDSYIESVEPSFATMSWSAISNISEAGNASSTFSVGDEKELQIGDETYHVQILGFNHDDKSDGSGKAGITVGLKEIMTTDHNMNSTDTNVGGWKDSEMRTYLNKTVHNSLPSDLQTVIKTVDKVSDNGNKDTTTLNTTQDKLFLLSFEEVGFTTSDSTKFVAGQGTKYEYFTDSNSRKKKYLSGELKPWWLRSTRTNNTSNFHLVYSDGNGSNSYADITYGVVFGFSI